MIKIFINNKPEDLSKSSGIIDVFELDDIHFEFHLDDDIPKVYIEDYELSIEKKDKYFISDKYKIFRECFGISYLRVYHKNEFYEYAINVLAEKVTSDKAEAIIEYVFRKNPNLLKVSFSRTTIERKLGKGDVSNIEAFLDFSQSLINYLDSNNMNLNNLIKKKFTSQKNIYSNNMNKNIDPEDVILNLDKIYQDSSSTDIVINRNFYSSSSLLSTDLMETYDFNENQVILSSLIYTHKYLKNILETFDDINLDESKNTDKEYFSLNKKVKKYSKDISKVILKVTCSNLLNRVRYLIKKFEKYIFLFNKKFKISYKGPIYPKLTKVVIANSFYKVIFNHIVKIYQCGNFSPNGVSAKIKVRSMSKIYEFFCLYKIIDSFESIGFNIIHQLNDEEIPSLIELESDDKHIEIYYEKTIKYIDDFEMQVSDLVSTNYYHKDKKYNFYNPDFVIQIQNKVSSTKFYYILDSKFRSYENLIRDNVLKEIKFKYFDNLSYLNIENKTLSKGNILGNIILYQGDINYSLYSNIHLKDFKSLPLFETVSLIDEFDSKLINDLVSYTN